MSKLTEKLFCRNCPYLNGIKEEGKNFGVEYVIFNSEEKFYIVDNPDVTGDVVLEGIKKFINIHVPKFGKYEVEKFVGYYMKEAILISKDITDLFNMELLCDDFPYNTTRVNKETIRERVMKCFDIVKEEKGVTYLKFKWERYDKL